MIDNPQTLASLSPAFADVLQNSRHALLTEDPAESLARVLTTFHNEHRAEVLRDAEEICDEAGASYTDRGLSEHADAAYELMERFRRKAEEAEQTAAAVPVLAATPPPVSRADVLHEAAIGYAEILGNVPDHSADPRYWQAIRDVIVGLRRMAAEAQQQADTGTREGRCGAWGGCPLPIGHNRGRADIPENHHGLSDDLFTGPQWETHDPEAEERERDIQRESQ